MVSDYYAYYLPCLIHAWQSSQPNKEIMQYAPQRRSSRRNKERQKERTVWKKLEKARQKGFVLFQKRAANFESPLAWMRAEYLRQNTAIEAAKAAKLLLPTIHE